MTICNFITYRNTAIITRRLPNMAEKIMVPNIKSLSTKITISIQSLIIGSIISLLSLFIIIIGNEFAVAVVVAIIEFADDNDDRLCEIELIVVVNIAVAVSKLESIIFDNDGNNVTGEFMIDDGSLLSIR